MRSLPLHFYEFEAEPCRAFPAGRTVQRPMVPFRLSSGDRTTATLLGLLDSGSDDCVFHFSLAEELGIDWRRCPTAGFHSASGKRAKLHYHMVTMTVWGARGPFFSYQMYAGFTGLPAGSKGLLGQTGFLDRFDVTLSRSRGTGRLTLSIH
ncbi:MAG: hypothetical protein NTX53_05845 [candidate division WOR-3 bacterium]|nr:hypothetical protein [candidate division WOR-3 bacterium]